MLLFFALFLAPARTFDRLGAARVERAFLAAFFGFFATVLGFFAAFVDRPERFLEDFPLSGIVEVLR